MLETTDLKMSKLSGSLEKKEMDPLLEAEDIVETGDRKHSLSASILPSSFKEK